MKIPYIRATDKDTGYEHEGFYFAYPSTTYCFAEDYNKRRVKIIHCLVTHRMMDWCLPNEPRLVSPIDPSTIKLLGYVDTDDEVYMPTEWIKNKDLDFYNALREE